MSLDLEKLINSGRIYLPADDKYEEINNGVPIDREIKNYAWREFPFPDTKNKKRCYSIPRFFIGHGEEQASAAERISHLRFMDLKLPEELSEESIWYVCFQGIAYAGRSNKSKRAGKIMSREHDLILFVKFKDKYFISLVEVKSTCDDPSTGYKVADAQSVKNNKRSGQHQIQDHIEILKNTCKIPIENIQCYQFWPFLTMWTADPKGNRVKRWESETGRHVFTDTISDQNKFNTWFHNNILLGRSMEELHFNILFKRFVVLSCGIFVNEIHDGMLALLSQEQVSLIHAKPSNTGIPTIVHGAAGTGKTLLILHKLKFLYEEGLLNSKNRALYICYWPGIRAEFKKKLEKCHIYEYVDTTRFFISRDDFLQGNKKKYRHIFMDECEAICLAFNEKIVSNTFDMIDQCRLIDHDEDFSSRQKGNTSSVEKNVNYGDLWFMVDINQATMFIPKFSPNILKKPTVTLSKVMRNTGTIYKVFSQFYKNPLPTIAAATKLTDLYLSNIDLGHNINGPPIYWVNSKITSKMNDNNEIVDGTFDGLIRVIIDLYSTKGIKPNDMCVLPFFVTKTYLPENVNKAISDHFVTDGYRPVCIHRVEEFLDEDGTKFLLPWVLRVKGLEFKVVVIIIDNSDFDFSDPEDRRKIYIMASRCTCLLIIVCSESVKDTIDVYKVMKAYPFCMDFAS